jgi:hypothetical protein
MGANATTFVPSYTSGEVLTAANLSVTNSGIPVFATTVTRDASFGGSGEKVLAEGQFAYTEATNSTQYYDGAAWLGLGGKVGQVVQATYATSTTTTSTSYVTTGLNGSITPSAATSKVLVLVTVPMSNQNGNGSAVATLFRGTVAGTNLFTATGFGKQYANPNDSSGVVSGNFLDSPNTTSATTYTVGFKTERAASTATAQTSNASSTITLIEVLA